MVLVSTGGQAGLTLIPFGAHDFNNCANSRWSSATPSCHNICSTKNPKLGRWVSTQRYHCKLYQEGNPSPMMAERNEELENVGFKWGTSKTSLGSVWSVRFQQLCYFKVQFGHCLVPRSKYSANPKLGKWVSTQRYHCKLYQEGKSSKMSAERI